MKPKDIYDVIIVGAGPSGTGASSYCERMGLKTLLIYKQFGGQVNFCEKMYSISSAPAIESKILLSRYRKTTKNVEKFCDCVNTIYKKNDIFNVIGEKEEYFSYSVIISTGRRPYRLNFKNYDGEMLTYEDYPFEVVSKDDIVLIIGGGYCGLDIASFLSAKVSKIIVVDKSNALGGNKYRRKSFLKNNNNTYHLNSQILFETNESVLIMSKDKISKKERITKFIIAVGCKPNTDFLDKSLLNKKGEIVVFKGKSKWKENMSRIEGLFAAGDVTDRPIHGFVSLAEGMGLETAKAVYYYLERNKRGSIWMKS
jgi:thioredoxin reductase